jgi:hypothetical protein
VIVEFIVELGSAFRFAAMNDSSAAGSGLFERSRPASRTRSWPEGATRCRARARVAVFFLGR